jgi:hypothetical protein
MLTAARRFVGVFVEGNPFHFAFISLSSSFTHHITAHIGSEFVKDGYVPRVRQRIALQKD